MVPLDRVTNIIAPVEASRHWQFVRFKRACDLDHALEFATS